MVKFLLTFFLSLFVIFPAFSKDYKIAELLEIAKQNSANIKAADYESLMQKHFAKQQKYWDNPVAGFNNSSEQKIYSVSQKIPFFGKLQKKYDIEDAGFKALNVRRDNVELLVKAEIFSLAYQYQATKKKIDLTQKRFDRLSGVEKYLSNIALNSPTKRAQGHITKDKIKSVQRDLVIYKNDLVQIWNRANVFLNLENSPDNIVLGWIDGFGYKGKNFFIKEAIDNNPELKEQKLLLQKYQSELAFAKIEQMPDVNVSVAREDNSSASLGKDSTQIGVFVAVALINQNQEKISSVKAKIKAQEYELYQTKNLYS